jgi:serine protein kinase
VLQLHGPVGSLKSTIARLLKKGLEQYSKTDEGMLFAFSWQAEAGFWTNAHVRGSTAPGAA